MIFYLNFTKEFLVQNGEVSTSHTSVLFPKTEIIENNFI